MCLKHISLVPGGEHVLRLDDVDALVLIVIDDRTHFLHNLDPVFDWHLEVQDHQSDWSYHFGFDACLDGSSSFVDC